MKTITIGQKIILFAILLFAANNAIGQQIGKTKSTKSDPNIPIFEIKNDLGQTVFAVYPGGVHIFIDDQLKATGGGFKVGRIGTEKATQGDIFTVDPGEVNVFINDALKATGGGFKVGRIGTEKATGDPDNYLTVTPDSTRIYTSETSNKGFAVGKLNAEIGTENFLNLTPDNYFIGHESGRKTIGQYNLFLGYHAGLENVYGLRNIFIGYNAGYNNIGSESSSTIGHDNIYIGTNAGRDNIDGEHNTLIGSYSGYISTGTKNTFFGAFTGFGSAGKHNVFLGVDAGRNNTTGDNNTFLGTIAGNGNSGANNTFVGYGSGYNNTSGTGSVFLGYLAGQNETTSNKLYIDNSSTSTPLIYGDFNSDLLRINGNFHISDNFIGWASTLINDGNANSRYGLSIQAGADNASGLNYMIGFYDGDGTYEGAITLNGGTLALVQASDIRLKENIQNTGLNALNLLNQLRVVDYNFKESNMTQTGYIAQEVDQVFPDMVQYNKEHDTYGIALVKLIPILNKAIQEQQEDIDALKKENTELKKQLSKIENLESEMKELRNLTEEILTKENK